VERKGEKLKKLKAPSDVSRVAQEMTVGRKPSAEFHPDENKISPGARGGRRGRRYQNSPTRSVKAWSKNNATPNLAGPFNPR